MRNAHQNLTIAFTLLFSASVSQAVAQDRPGKKEKPATRKVSAEVPRIANSTCPIMGKPASKLIHVDTRLGRIYVCCAPCIKKVRRDVERTYTAAYPTTKNAGNKVCPITKRKIEKKSPSVILQGIRVAVCCIRCEKPARERTQITLVNATKPRTRDVGNLTCPVTGKRTRPNIIILIGDDLIRLSSPECIEKVKKSPATFLATARSIAERERKNPQKKKRRQKESEKDASNKRSQT